MEWVETTGRTLAEAMDRALDELGIDEEEAEFVVLAEPRQGWFGRLRGEARVRARVRPTRPRPKVERRKRRSRNERNGSEGAAELRPAPERTPGPGVQQRVSATSAASSGADAPASRVASIGVGGPATPGRDRAGSGRRRRGGAAAETATDTTAADEGAGSSPSGTGESSTSTSTPGSVGDAARSEGSPLGEVAESTSAPRSLLTGAPVAAPTISAAAAVAANPPADAEPAPSQEEELSTKELGDRATTFLRGLVDAFGVEAEVAIVEIDEDNVEARVDGPDLGLLIGPRAATLAAVQDLTRAAVQRDSGRDHRLHLDIGGYRQRRKAALARFAADVAANVRSSGQAQRLEPMGAADRKVIHDTIGGIEGVRSSSVGEDPHRCVVIEPVGAAGDE